VHDPITNQLFEIDPRSASEDVVPTQLPEFTRVEATDGAAVIVRESPLAVWRVRGRDLGALSNLDAGPLTQADGPGIVGVAPMDQLIAVEADTGVVHWFQAGVRKFAPIEIDLVGTPISASIIDASAVVLTDAGELVVLGPEGVEHWVDLSILAPGTSAAVLERSWVQSNAKNDAPASSVFVVSATGDLMEVQLGSDPSVLFKGRLGGLNPVRVMRVQTKVAGSQPRSRAQVQSFDCGW